jgi:hypothetical protein
MTSQRDSQINYLNIGLMFASAALAYFLPFETFLLAYAFLGPLHYLTEISWLHDRQYFTKGKFDFIILLIIGILLSYAAFSKDFNFNQSFYNAFVKANLFDKLTVLALFSAVLFIFIENFIIKLFAILFLFAMISGWLTPENTKEPNTLIYALTSLLPTLIHVYVFTGLFMLFGALKSRSKTGILSVAFFILIPIILVFGIKVNLNPNRISNYGKTAYYADGDGFFYTNVSILDHFGLIEEPLLTNKQFLDSIVNNESSGNTFPVEEKKRLNELLKNKPNENYVVTNPESEFYNKTIPLKNAVRVSSKDYYWDSVFNSTFGIMLMRFIAFAYLYHYLNWFSKTEIIRWHKVPKVRFLSVILLWLISCGLYAYDYGIGLSFLFFLSFTHVLLEFPLNITSLIGIQKESFSILKNGFVKKNAG